MARNLTRHAAVSFLLIALSACSSAPATRYYVLTPIPADSAGAEPRDVAVVVTGVRLPQYLDRSQIVTRGGDNRLQVDDDERWGGNLRQDMTRLLTENLGRLLGSDRVVAAPHTLRMQPDYRVEVEVLRFERNAAGRVQLEAKWWLTRGAGGVPLASPSAVIYGAPLGEGAAFDAVVASMSAAYNELARAIAAAIRARPAGGS